MILKIIKELLKNHLGYVIAINATNPEKLEPCGLKVLGSEYLSLVTQKELRIHIPYFRILSIFEDDNGGSVTYEKGLIGTAQAKLVIHIEHMIIYKGAIGFGFQTPV